MQYRSNTVSGGTAGSFRVSSVWSNRLTTRLGVNYNNKRRGTRPNGIDGPDVRVYNGTIASSGRLFGNSMLGILGNSVLYSLAQPNHKATLSFDATLVASQGTTSHELQAGGYPPTGGQGNHLSYINGGFTFGERACRHPRVYHSC